MKKFWAWVISIFKSSWFKAFLMIVTQKLKEILEKIGRETYEKIVAKAKELNGTNLTGTEKAKALAEYIKSLVPDIGDSAVNYLIESVVQSLKSKAS